MNAQIQQHARSGIFQRRLSHAPDTTYDLAMPDTRPQGVVALIHGVSRNHADMIRAFRGPANAHKLALIAPLFDPLRCPDYQRLGRARRGPRSDWILDAILEEVGDLLNCQTRRFSMFGFSAGAQFAHRYAMVHPGRIVRLALGAAGWYTWPHPRRFPYGLNAAPDLPDLRVDLRRFLAIPTRVYVGSRDIERDATLRTSARIDRQQGLHRFARAANWVRALQRAARNLGLPQRADVEEMKGIRHSFEEAAAGAALPRRVIDFMTVAHPTEFNFTEPTDVRI